MAKLDFNKSIAFFRDKWVPIDKANLSIASSSVLYGLSVYTVLNAIWNPQTKQLNAFRVRAHYDRLCNSAKIMDFKDFSKSYSYTAFEKILRDLLKKNQVQEDVLIRFTIFVDETMAGTKIHGLKNSLGAFVYPMGEILPRSGIDVCVSSWTRVADNMIPSRAKVNGQYVNASLIKNEALLNGYHEAIVLDQNGHVSEGTVANFFIVRNGVVISPDDSTDLLEGITRNSIIEILKASNIRCELRSIDRSELYIADEAFMCGSSANITPVLTIDKRPINRSKIGPITKKLTEAYKQIQLGNDEGFKDWITTI